MLGKMLVTHQTGPEGKEIKRLLIEEGCDIKKEYYVGLVLDRATRRVVLMASEEGGTEIEEVAEKTPEKIVKEVIDPAVGHADVPGEKNRLRHQHPERACRQGG